MFMTTPATQVTPQDDPGPQAAHAAGTSYDRQALHKLTGMAMDFATLLHAQTTALAQPQAAAAQAAATQPVPAPDSTTLVSLAAAFNGVARTVRRCILLAQSLDKPAPDPARHRTAARKQIIRAVEDRIQRPNDGAEPDSDSADALRAELHERLDAPDLDEDIASRPIPDIIVEITRDLGLAAAPGTHPWRRRTPADIEDLCARAAAPTRTPQPGAPPSQAPLRPQHSSRQRAPRSQDANPRVGPAPAPPGDYLPDNPADTIALILGHPRRNNTLWCPPPDD